MGAVMGAAGHSLCDARKTGSRFLPGVAALARSLPNTARGGTRPNTTEHDLTPVPRRPWRDTTTPCLAACGGTRPNTTSRPVPRRRTAARAVPFFGHYVILCGYDERAGEFLFRDPASKVRWHFARSPSPPVALWHCFFFF